MARITKLTYGYPSLGKLQVMVEFELKRSGQPYGIARSVSAGSSGRATSQEEQRGTGPLGGRDSALRAETLPKPEGQTTRFPGMETQPG